MADLGERIASWRAAAADELRSRQNADGGWPYVAGERSSTEPTALALLALPDDPANVPARSAGTDWLLARRRDDGLWTAWPEAEAAIWVTPLAAMAAARAGFADDASADALLEQPVYTMPTFLTAAAYGYDTQIRGWAYTTGTFSLTEPTALATIFLKRAGRGGHARVREAVRLLHDRALDAGGWNYGEPRVWGGALYPSASSTALALLALADEPDERTADGADWLAGRHASLAALFSLGWATIAMNVLDRLDDAGRAGAIDRWDAAPADRRGPVETALCLLALADRTGHPMAVIP